MYKLPKYFFCWLIDGGMVWFAGIHSLFRLVVLRWLEWDYVFNEWYVWFWLHFVDISVFTLCALIYVSSHITCMDIMQISHKFDCSSNVSRPLQGGTTNVVMSKDRFNQQPLLACRICISGANFSHTVLIRLQSNSVYSCCVKQQFCTGLYSVESLVLCTAVSRFPFLFSSLVHELFFLWEHLL